jgi:hypothetical protein
VCTERPICSLCSKYERANCAVAQTCRDFAIIAQNRAKTTWLVLANSVSCRVSELQEWSNGCKERPICSLCSKYERANCAVTVAQTCRDFAIIAPNRAKTTWPLLVDGAYCKLVELQEWFNGCKERPVCSLCSKNARANRAVAQTWRDFAIIAPNRAKTTWPLLADGACCKRVELQEWFNGYKERPVCSL